MTGRRPRAWRRHRIRRTRRYARPDGGSHPYDRRDRRAALSPRLRPARPRGRRSPAGIGPPSRRSSSTRSPTTPPASARWPPTRTVTTASASGAWRIRRRSSFTTPPDRPTPPPGAPSPRTRRRSASAPACAPSSSSTRTARSTSSRALRCAAATRSASTMSPSGSRWSRRTWGTPTGPARRSSTGRSRRAPRSGSRPGSATVTRIGSRDLLGHAMANDSRLFEDRKGWRNDHTDWPKAETRTFRKRVEPRTRIEALPERLAEPDPRAVRPQREGPAPGRRTYRRLRRRSAPL